MGTCRYCGNDAGWLRSSHAECEARLKEGSASYLAGTTPFEELERIATETRVADQPGQHGFIVGTWEKAVDRLLEDGELSTDEEKRLATVQKLFGITQNDLDRRGKFTALGKASVLRQILEGTLPDNIEIANSPFNLLRGERLVWLFNGVEYYEDRTRRSYRGISHGLSVRILKGVYYRPSIFQVDPVERSATVLVDRGVLGIGSKALYFHSPSKGLRIQYPKIVTFTPFKDGIGIHREAMTARPQLFVTGDGWFTYNLVTNLAEMRG